ncbi:MAG: S1 RNA-binding domain-containing protein [Chloroflexota bacterium]|nr:S1 RNA-binding domain-containing protein [Chloroflexota bacterium]
MSGHTHRREPEIQPEPLEESYWAALLHEGEFADAVNTSTFQSNGHYSLYEAGASAPVMGSVAESAGLMNDWEEMRRIMDADLVLELPVIGLNRGGLLVEWRSLRGFVPASQLVEYSNGSAPLARRPDLNDRIGTKLVLRVIELDIVQNRLILSERAAKALPGERADLLHRLKHGEMVQGVVTNLCDFGAFVDLGGLEGLIHISELSWGRVGHPADLLKRGQEIAVFVLDVHPEQGRVALSLKRLNPDPWETVHLRYRLGEVVEGTITNVVDFGAFARIEEGLEGLIHVSELAEGHFLHPRNVVSEGQFVRARILSIDGRSRRLGLSLRAMNQHNGNGNGHYQTETG